MYKNLLIIIFNCLINRHVNIDISIDKFIDKGSFRERIRTAGAGIYGKDDAALFLWFFKQPIDICTYGQRHFVWVIYEKEEMT